MKWFLALLLPLFLFTCANNSSSPAMTSENSVVVGWSQGVTTLDPACTSGFESAEITSQIFERLVRINVKTGEPIPHLAKSWKSSTDGLIWDFTIRRGITFHDGTPLTAKAVAFSFQRQMDGVKAEKAGKPTRSGCPLNYWKGYFDMISSVHALDDWHVRFKLKHLYSPFLFSLELFAVGIVPPYDTKKDPDAIEKKPVGTGPFMFKETSPKRTILVANPNYWKPEDRPSFKYLIFQTIPETSQRLLALKGGKVDLAHQINPDKQLTLNLHPFLDIKSVKSVNITYLALNTQLPPFNVKQNRIAANHLLDRDKIVKLVYQGNGEVGNAPFPPYLTMGGEPVYNKNMDVAKWYKHDPDMARQLFIEGGYLDGKGAKILDLYLIRSQRTTLPAPLLMANLIKNDFAKLGIQVNIHALPFRDFKSSIRLGKHHMVIHTWIGDMWDPDNFLYGLLHSYTGTNYANFTNSAYDSLVQKGRSEIKRIQRILLYRKALKLFKEEAPWVPLAFTRPIIGHSSRISNILHTSSTISRLNKLRVAK